MTIKQYLILGVIIVLGLFGFSCARKHAKKVDSVISNPILAANQKEKIILNPQNHTITVVTKNGTKVSNLPTHTVSVVENNNGTLSIQDRVWGYEFSPWLGFALADKPRYVLGLDLLYFHKLDLGFGIAPDFKSTSVVGVASLGYNIYSNTSIWAGVTSTMAPCAGVKIKF